MDYVPHTGRRFTVSYEMKTIVTWIYSASHFASVEGAQGFIDRVCSLWGRVENQSGDRLRQIVPQSVPKDWLTTTMTLNYINPLRRALPLSFPVR